jgi:hypothetical protein
MLQALTQSNSLIAFPHLRSYFPDNENVSHAIVIALPTNK